ncbi:MAG: phosphatase PAP2 family protein [Bryobacteraceae bacterium]
MTAHHTMLNIIATGDHKLMRKINKWRAPKWIQLLAIGATRAGDGWLWCLVGLLILIFGGESRLAAVAAAGSAAVVGIGIFILVKKISGRKRPCEIEPNCWARLLPPDRFSFPSGHTITAFGVAIALGSFYPVLLPGLLFCAACIAVSRILLGMHFLSDVLAGAMLGVGLALGSRAIFA